MHSVLFVCTGNQFRSPIAAEAFRRQLIRDGRAQQWRISSAGTWASPGHNVLPAAVELAQLFGLNIEGHVTRMLDAKMLEESSLILVMEEGHKESIQAEFPFSRQKVHMLSQVLEGLLYDIPDPAGARDEAKGIIRDLVEAIHAGHENIYKIVEAA
jgi:protein-tyrosine phosphatase